MRWLSIWIDVHLTLKEYQNQWMKKARAAEARLWTLTKTHGVVSESLRGVHVACVQAVTQYWSELWWDPNGVGRWDDLQLLLNRQARTIMRTLPTTPRGALMRESGVTPKPVILDSRQKRLTAGLANICSSKLKEVCKDSSSGTTICQVAETKHDHAQTSETMSSQAPG